LKKLQVPLIVLVLFGVVYMTNYFTEQQRKDAAALSKQAEKTKQAAELEAASKNAPKSTGKHAAAFALPANAGPLTAPVKLEIFVNDTNSCHSSSIAPITELQKAYGNVLRVEWYSVSDPKVSARADKLKVGCEAGLLVNGKIERQVIRNGGKVLISFRGPAGEKYKMEDVYMALNQDLKTKGKKPPAAAVAGEKPPVPKAPA
jgi:hypothetical protein